MTRPCHVLRVFTRGDEGGNHLGVVNDVVEVTTDQMQAIATDLGYSETVFIDWIDPEADPTVRIFTPADELPFAGHPLVGAAWVLAMLGPSREGPTGRIMTGVGPVAYSVEGEVVTVTCDLDIELVAPDDTANVAVSAGLPEPISTMRLGLPKEYLIAEYPDFGTVAALAPDMDALTGRFGFLAYARDGDVVKARFFAPGTAVPEDPATGSAAVALARSFSLRGESDGAVTVLQGDEIGHPSTIVLTWSPGRTTIAGTVRRDGVVQVR
jgi:trans-2,3-dihydro-3-hydroxyanthranilate isomerase